jgi:hypothetical protein
MKEAPMVEVIEAEGVKAWLTKRCTRLVLPTAWEPSTTSFASMLGGSDEDISPWNHVAEIHEA